MYEIVCEESPKQQVLALTASLARAEIAGFLDAAYPALFGALAAAGAHPAGPPLARYHVDDQAFHVTAGVPFGGDIDPPADMVTQSWPALTLATTMHVGPYEDLPAAFHAVIEWTQANGCTIIADPWESYLDGPDAAQPRTKVCFPVVRS